MFGWCRARQTYWYLEIKPMEVQEKIWCRLYKVMISFWSVHVGLKFQWKQEMLLLLLSLWAELSHRDFFFLMSQTCHRAVWSWQERKMWQVFKESSISYFWPCHVSELATCSWKTSPSTNSSNFNVIPCSIPYVYALKLCTLKKSLYWPEYNLILCFLWKMKASAFQSSYFSQLCPE